MEIINPDFLNAGKKNDWMLKRGSSRCHLSAVIKLFPLLFMKING